MATENPAQCPPPMKATSEGVFQGNNPLDYALPLVIVQICLVLVLTRVLAYLLKPLRQPRVIAEIIVSFYYHKFIIIQLFLFGILCCLSKQPRAQLFSLVLFLWNVPLMIDYYIVLSRSSWKIV